MKTKKDIIESLELVREDCQAVCDSLEDGSYREPWDFNDYSNWECMASIMDDAIEYIKKGKRK